MKWKNKWVRQKWLFWVPWTALIVTTFFGRVGTKVILINLVAISLMAYYIMKYGD